MDLKKKYLFLKSRHVIIKENCMELISRKISNQKEEKKKKKKKEKEKERKRREEERRFSITNIISLSPDDGLLEPKRCSLNLVSR